MDQGGTCCQAAGSYAARATNCPELQVGAFYTITTGDVASGDCSTVGTDTITCRLDDLSPETWTVIGTGAGVGAGDMTKAVYDIADNGQADIADAAVALTADPANCATSTHFAVGVTAAGVATCEAIGDGDVPDSITVTLAGTATALAANGANCTAGNYPLGVDASGAVEDCTAAAAGASISFDATNDAVNESAAITHIECNGNGMACAEANADEARIALSIGAGATQVAAGDHDHTLAGDVDGTTGTNDLDEAAVEAELEAVLDLDALQGAVTDAQVPDSITVTTAATATNALALEGTDFGTLTDTKVCVYDLAGTEIDCNVNPVVDTDTDTTCLDAGVVCSFAASATEGGNASNADALEGTDLGTLTNAKWCVYDSAGTEIDCNVDPVVDTDTDDQTCAEVSGCVPSAIVCAGVPACETDDAHDTCAEISGCVVGAITAETDSAHDTCAEITGCVTAAQAGDTDLTAVAAMTGSGIVVRNNTGPAWTPRTLVNADGNVVITNADGVSGNPTFSLGANVSLLGQTIAPAEMAATDFGSFTCNGTTCSVDTGAITSAMILDGTIGSVDLSTGLLAFNTARTLWVTTDGTDVADGGGDCSTLGCCGFSHACATYQQAINEATEMSPPVDRFNPVIIRSTPGYYLEQNIKFYNTDPDSPSYMMPAHGLRIEGNASIVAPPTAMTTGDCIFDISGTFGLAFRSIGIQIGEGNDGGSAICSNGGAQGWAMDDVDIQVTGNNTRAFNIRGAGNVSVEANLLRATQTVQAAGHSKGRAVHWEAGAALDGALNGTTDEGRCIVESGSPHATCVADVDCGGRCNLISTVPGDFCAANADCGIFGQCTIGTCFLQSSDVLIRRSLITLDGAPWTYDKVRTCDGGVSSNGTGTVEVDFDATCESGNCDNDFTTEPVSLTCNTNTDCQRYVIGTGTDFDGTDNLPNTADDNVKFGQGIIVNPGGSQERRTVRMVRTATLLEVSAPFSSNDAASLAFRTSSDGNPCITNSDCSSGASTGVCTAGTGGTVQLRFKYTEFDGIGDTGECVDSTYDADWPPIGCNANSDCSGSSPAGDLCKGALLKANGAISVDAAYSTFLNVPLGTALNYNLIAVNSATINTQHSALDQSLVAKALSGTVVSTSDGNFRGLVLHKYPTCAVNADCPSGAVCAAGAKCQPTPLSESRIWWSDVENQLEQHDGTTIEEVVAVDESTCVVHEALTYDSSGNPVCTALNVAQAAATTGNLRTDRGGTGSDSSAATGIARVAGGTWTYGAVSLANADSTGTTPVTKGGTGLATVADKTVLVGSGSNVISALATTSNDAITTDSGGNIAAVSFGLNECLCSSAGAATPIAQKITSAMLDATDIVTLAGTQTLTNKTLTAPVIGTINGGTASGDDLALNSTTNATKGNVTLAGKLTVDEVNGRVGVLDLTPDVPFDVVGDTADAPTGYAGIGWNPLARVARSLATTPGSFAVGLLVDGQVAAGVDVPGSFDVLHVDAVVPSGHSTTIAGTVRGFNARAVHIGTGTVGAVIGNDTAARIQSTGTATSMVAFRGAMANNAGGTATRATTMNATRPVGRASGSPNSTWTNIDGIRIEDQNPSGASNTLTNPPQALTIDSQTATGALAIRQSGTDDHNRLAGLTSFGADSNATETMHLSAGNFRIEGGSSTGYIDIGEYATTTDAAAPSDNRARLYVRDNASGKEQLIVRFASGAVQVLATEP